MEDPGFTELADLELARLVRDRAWESGGGEAFWTLWLRYEKSIWRTVKRHASTFCRSLNVASDVFALDLLELVEKRLRSGVGGYGGSVPFGGFLKKVVLFAAIDQYRYYKRRPEARLPETEDDLAVQPGWQYRKPMFPSPELSAIAKEGRAILKEALILVGQDSATKAKWAKALHLSFFRDRTVREIAAEMGCTEDAVNQYLTRGRKAVGEKLDQFGVKRPQDLMP